LALLTFIVPQETMNLTFVVLPISMLLAMLWLLLKNMEAEHLKSIAYPAVFGVLGGAIICLKSTYLPIVGAYALFPYALFYWRKRERALLKAPFIAGCGALVVMAAWMIAMNQTSGTFLFPILGNGVDYSAYGWFQSLPVFTTSRSILKVFLQAIALSILGAVQMAGGVKSDRSRLSLAILIASIFAITAFNWKSGGDFVWRYNFPQFFCAILIFYLATAAEYPEHRSTMAKRLPYAAGLAAMILMVFYYDLSGTNPMPFRQMRAELHDDLTAVRAGVRGTPIASAAHVQEYRAVEASMPVGAVALENAGYPFLFNFANRTIHIMDWPGASSPRPGWPLGAPASALAQYLRQHSIRYVIYDSGYMSWNSAGSCVSLYRRHYYSTELYKLFWITVLSNHQLEQLRARYRSIYDDGKMAVIDLQQPLSDPPPDADGWTAETPIDAMCSSVWAHYEAYPRQVAAR
jgi:hypothetical protein